MHECVGVSACAAVCWRLCVHVRRYYECYCKYPLVCVSVDVSRYLCALESGRERGERVCKREKKMEEREKEKEKE